MQRITRTKVVTRVRRPSLDDDDTPVVVRREIHRKTPEAEKEVLELPDTIRSDDKRLHAVVAKLAIADLGDDPKKVAYRGKVALLRAFRDVFLSDDDDDDVPVRARKKKGRRVGGCRADDLTYPAS